MAANNVNELINGLRALHIEESEIAKRYKDIRSEIMDKNFSLVDAENKLVRINDIIADSENPSPVLMSQKEAKEDLIMNYQRKLARLNASEQSFNIVGKQKAILERKALLFGCILVPAVLPNDLMG